MGCKSLRSFAGSCLQPSPSPGLCPLGGLAKAKAALLWWWLFSRSVALLAGCGGVGMHPCSLHGHQDPTQHTALGSLLWSSSASGSLSSLATDLSWKPWNLPDSQG